MNISETKFWSLIHRHSLWLAGHADGQRAVMGGMRVGSWDMTEVDLRKADLRGADFTEAYLNECWLDEADLSGAVFRRACLGCASMKGAVLEATDFCAANLYAAEMQEVKARGVCLHGANLAFCRLDRADLSQADLRLVNLMIADLTRATLIEANLRGADLSEACLEDAVAQRACLHRARLVGVELDRCDLTGADLTRADLSYARLNGACFQDATTRGLISLLARNGRASSAERLDALPAVGAELRVIFSRALGPQDYAALLDLVASLASDLRLESIEFHPPAVVLTGDDPAALEGLADHLLSALSWLEIERIETPGTTLRPGYRPTPCAMESCEEASHSGERGKGAAESVGAEPEQRDDHLVKLTWSPEKDSTRPNLILDGLGPITASESDNSGPLVEFRLDDQWASPHTWAWADTAPGVSQRSGDSGGLHVVESVRGDGELERAVSIKCPYGAGPYRLGEVALRLPPLCLGEAEDCCYVIPDEFPPRRRPILTSRPTSRRGRFGVVVHNSRLKRSLVVLPFDMSEPAVTWAHELGGSIVLSTVFSVQARLESGRTEHVGSQWLLGVDGSLEEAIAAVSLWRQRRGLGVRPLPQWARQAVVFGVHPAGTMAEIQQGRLGTFRDLQRRLPKIRNLQCNTLWILPVYECDLPWLYSLKAHDRIDARFGTAEDCRALIEQARALGFRVLFDLVPHGPVEGSDLLRQHPDFVCVAADGEPVFRWGCPACDYANPEYQRWLVDVAERFLREFKLDGFRIDCAEGGPENWSRSTGYRASHAGIGGGLSLLNRLHQRLSSINPETVLFSEVDGDALFFCSGHWVLDQPFYRVLRAVHDYADINDWVNDLGLWMGWQDLSTPPHGWPARFLETPDTEPVQEVMGVDLLRPLAALIGFSRCVPLLFDGMDERLAQHFREILAVRERFGQFASEQVIPSPPHPGSLHLRRGRGDDSLDVYINFTPDQAEFTHGERRRSIPAFGWLVAGARGVEGQSRQHSSQRIVEHSAERLTWQNGDWSLVWNSLAGGRLQGVRRGDNWLLTQSDLVTSRGIYDDGMIFRQSLDNHCRLSWSNGSIVTAEGRLTSLGTTGFERYPGNPALKYLTSFDVRRTDRIGIQVEVKPHADIPARAATLVHTIRLPDVERWAVRFDEGQWNEVDSDGCICFNGEQLDRPLSLRCITPSLGGFEIHVRFGCQRLELRPVADGGELHFFLLDNQLGILPAGEPIRLHYELRTG
jgi:uncharacterized protein YjbI with pentapeptide repeats